MAPEEEEEGEAEEGPGAPRENSAAMDINTNTAAPAGLPGSGQGALMGPPTPSPPSSLGFVEGGGALSAPPAPASRVFLSSGGSEKEVGCGLIKVGVPGPQRKSSGLVEAPRLPVPGAMPAPLAPSPSGRAGRPGISESADGGRRRCLGAAGPAPAASPVPTSLLWVSAGHLQLTSPKFRAPARWPRSGLPRVRRAGGPSFQASLARTRQAPRPRCWRRGLKETAPSPQFVDPRWGCSRFPDCRGTVGPFPAPAPAPAAAAAPPQLPRRQEPRAPAQVSVATCVRSRPEPALGVHVRPRPRVCISGGLWRRWSPGLQEGGGTRGASSRSLTPRTSN